MGYVIVTEFIGQVSKSYHFESYDDFKDWENKISGVVVSAPEIKVNQELWYVNIEEYPPKGLSETDRVAVKFANGIEDDGIVMDYYGWNSERKRYWSVDEQEAVDYHITHYRKLS